jgi:RNA polymerase sigma-70 factor (ECF subfamily)
MAFSRTSALTGRAADPELNDALLIAAARVDRHAFAPLYARYVGPVYRYCYARLRSREAAEDATSEVFIKALAALPGYRDQAFAPWLFRIAHNVVVDAHRRRRPTEPLTAAEDTPDPAHSPDEQVLSKAEREALWAAIGGLPDDQRASVELRLIGWADGRIGDALGRTPAAVRMLRLRALGRLRALLNHPG